MSITFAAHPRGIQAIPLAQQHALASMISGVPRPVIIDASEGAGRSLADIVAFLKAGGIWLSWGGYPFYYTPSQPSGSGSNFYRFCQLAGVPDPNPAHVGSEFFGPPNGTTRILWTPTAILPTPWIAGISAQRVGQAYVWPLIAVPVGLGWWCYASTNYGSITADQYAAFVQSLIPKTTAASTKPSGLPPWLFWTGLGIMGALGLGAIVWAERQ